MDAENASDADRVEPPVVDQPPDRLRMDAQLVRNLTDTDKPPGIAAYGRHNSSEALQVPQDGTWADRTKSAVLGT